MEHEGTAGIHRLIARRFPWICAILIHLSLYAALTDMSTTDRAVLKGPKPIAVDIIFEHLTRAAGESPEVNTIPAPAAEQPLSASPDALAALPESREPSEADPPSKGPETNAAPPKRIWVTATRFHAGEVLGAPRSAQARAALATLSEAERREQLCALEAMEQVRRAHPGFRPTRLVPHAIRNSFRKENAVVAPAAAFRSNRLWYEIAYRCQLDETGTGVTGFEFALGDPVERSLWDELGLAATH
ncbi:DUF930 domain-containing protein [Roseibium aggregatum]|uniref:DUF930 domain-containing protein n=1 Tax=Roseibium aggregatum TaxID=187304 RepID=A0A939J3K4_9HYPH|nr:DUF930 domain-containing protein [Roseibium aggregatum]MBN9669764.1 DUF930 domain-containing protein [Roseibium aggregatum]